MIRWEERSPEEYPYWVAIISEMRDWSWGIISCRTDDYRADYRTPECQWADADAIFTTLEEAKHWLEMIYITGAWK